jgi:uncharacterized protein
MTDMKYKFSRFFHVFEREGVVCCYNALTISTIYIPCMEFDKIKAYIAGNNVEYDDAIFHKMLSENMIIPYDTDEELLLEQIRSEVFNGVKIRVMVLHMTDYCNLRCKYCFIEGGQPENYTRKTMSEDVAKAAVDKFVEIVRRGHVENNAPTVVFYGGEPLANWKVLQKTLEYIQKKEEEEKIKFDKVIITNGTLIEPAMTDVLKKFGVMVSVSLDGVQEVHDANRIDYDGKGSFEKTINGIKVLQAAGIEPAVSCVMAKEGLDKYEETIRFLIEDLSITGMGFNHVSIIPGLNYYDPEYEEKFADSIIKVQELIQYKYPYVYERRMGHKVNAFIDKKLIKSDCTGCGEQISVSTDGQIGICQGYMGSRKTFTHTVFDLNYYPDEDETFIEWSRRSPLNIEECTHCSALAICGGGCPRNADMLHGSIWNVDSAFCHFARKAQEWLLWEDIYER